MPASNKSLLLRYFVYTFIFSWLVWSTGVLSTLGWIELPLDNFVFVVIGAHGPLVAAIYLTVRHEGWGAVIALLRSGFRVRMRALWWLAILLLPLALTGLSVWLNVARSDFQLDMTLLSQPLLILPTYLMMFFFGGSFQEEFGWRGYALPRMLKLWKPLTATAILGTIWSVWHLPLFFTAGVSQAYMPFLVFFVMTFALSIIFGWVYLRTGRNLFSALLLHTAINASLNVFPPLELRDGGNQTALTYLMAGYVVVAVLVVLLDRKTWASKVEA